MGRKFQATVEFVEQRKSAFAISRLIMLTGLDIRAEASSPHDDERRLQQVLAALESLLTPSEQRELAELLR